MSITLLTQVSAEARRLAVAGSIVARGDFRLKKLLPQLAEVGKTAPVFAKIGEAATAVVEGPEEKGAESLLELVSLTNAVLYTQGETGIEGKLESIETTDLGAPSVPTSARVLKPLLEALTSTGSGRLELVKDAADRGLFRDLRLVKPALAALDDPYAEIGDLIGEKVLPLYGTAVLPELRAKYDPKGAKGHPRRLKLMHALDPAGTRELVKAALDGGPKEVSKEVKVAAISCLGSSPDDLAFLLEQAIAKAQDVREAAYQALANVTDPAAVAVFQKALTGKDHVPAARAIQNGANKGLADLVVAQVRADVDGMLKAKNKKDVSALADRVTTFLAMFPDAPNPKVEALLLELFDRREEIAKAKGDTFSGSDVFEYTVAAMASGSPASKAAVVKRHAEVPADRLDEVFDAAREVLSPAKLYDQFSVYLTTKELSKKNKAEANARREAIVESFGEAYNFGFADEEDTDPKQPPFDPRWLDLALAEKESDMIRALARPGHPGAMKYAKADFDAAMKKAKSPDDVDDQVALLMRLRHPDATDAFFAALGKRPKKAAYYRLWWYLRLVPLLPKAAVPRLEEYVVGLPDAESKPWIDALHELRTKAD